MNATKKILALFSAAALSFGAWAAVPGVTITSVQQDYPTGNKVTVKYTVADGVDDDSYSVKFYATINNNVSEVAVTATDSKTLLATGDHEVTWDAASGLYDTAAGFAAKVIAKDTTTDPVSVAELKKYSDDTFATKGDYLTKTEASSTYATSAGVTSGLAAKADSTALAGYVPTTRTVNGKALSADISLTAADVGALASYTETDPTVPAWAKAADKPTYAYSEITGTPSVYTKTEVDAAIVAATNGLATGGAVSISNFSEMMAAYEMENAFGAPVGTFTATYNAQNYMIVNLATGFIAYNNTADTSFFNQTPAKTQYMVFRRVPAGSYPMRTGADTTEPQDTNATGVMAKDYYIAIFECTAAQYSYIVNGTASTTVTPQNNITWNTIRDSAAVDAKVANTGSGVVAKLNKLTQNKMDDSTIYFDLPTETMWQIAAQASGDPRYLRFYGEGTTDLSKYAHVQKGTSASALAAVGSYLPNQWGLYDVYGNVWEWCLDATATVSWNNNVQNAADDQSLTQSPTTAGNSRVLRGSSAYSGHALAWARSGSRSRDSAPSSTAWSSGFRLARIVP